MPLQTLDGYSKLIANLEDQPTMAASELKAYWDSSPEEIREAFNKAITVLRSTTDGDSGADNIGATQIKDVDGKTVQTILESLKVIIDCKYVLRMFLLKGTLNLLLKVPVVLVK
mgnify:CR=1 FL=1